MSGNLQQLLTFNVDNQRFALHLDSVERVIRAVAVTNLIDAPPFIEGVIDYNGEVIAVLNMRKRFGYPVQEIKLSDHFVIANTSHRTLALVVDQVSDVLLPDLQDVYASKELVAGIELMPVLRDDKGLILVYDLEKLLSIVEDIQLKNLIEKHTASSNLL